MENEIKYDYLSGDTINKVMEIITRETPFTPVNVNLMGIYNEDNVYPFPPILEKHLQVLSDKESSFVGEISHWVTFYYDGTVIHVFDSLNRKIVTKGQKLFLSQILGRDCDFEFHTVQNQTNGLDCGVYALAFATAICVNLEPKNETYVSSVMRGHILNMISANKALPFPTESQLVNDSLSIGECFSIGNSSVSIKHDKNKTAQGRPRKISKTGRPKVEKTENTGVKKVDTKVRGRPKKEIKINDEEKVEKKARGRPKKEVVCDSVEVCSEVVANNATKRGPGRPKKNCSVKFVDVSTKNTRGRPKKKVEGDSAGDCSKGFQTKKDILTKKAPGRPKKKVVSDSAEGSSEVVQTKKARGRPKKQIECDSVKVPKIVKKSESENVSPETTYFLQKISLDDCYKCPHCNSRLFIEESSKLMWCCGNGRIHIKLPQLNASFYDEPQFLSHSRAYNNLFAFSAMGVSEGFQIPKSGPSLVKIQGRIYHRVFDLNYKGSVNNSSLYIDDGKERLKIAENEKLDKNIIDQISKFLHEVNPFISSLKQLHNEKSENAHLVFEKTSRKTHGPILGDRPSCAEIAGILYTTPNADPRKVVIWKKNERQPQFVPFLDPAYESLQYPLLFPHGSAGWSIDMLDDNNRKITQTKYYRYLLLSDSRFTSLDRLGQEYFVDMWCRVEEEKLRYIRFNQSKFLRMAPRSEIDESIEAEGGPKPGKVYLPSSYTHGPRYMQLKYQDGMAIVSRLGKPTLFITKTCNPNWPEIKSNLSQKQSHIDRPDLCDRVFNLKLNRLLKDLKSGKIFGKMVYILYVIEFQKRGLPHAHIACRVEPSNLTHDEIDKFVRATIPGPDEYGGKLRERVLKHMVHGPCGLENQNSPCMDNSKCTKNYPKPFLECTYTDERGYVHYKRPNKPESVALKKNREINNQWIVPYNPDLLMMFDCHINVEIASTVKIIKYLFKYIHKGPDMAKVSIVPDSNDEVVDEIENYVKMRYISASEAMWRLFEFDVSGRQPTVIPLPIHLPNEDIVIFEEGKEQEASERSLSKLELYFSRPRSVEFENLTYLEFYEQYRLSEKRDFESKKKKFVKRVRGEVVARMYWLSPTLGEIYYLRMLLGKFPAYSYEDLKKVDEVSLDTFQKAAYAKGLLSDVNEYEQAIVEAAGFKTGRDLRILFFNLIISGAPSVILWEKFRDLLSEDFLDKFSNHSERAHNKSLCHIDSMLRKHGKSAEDVGLPVPLDDSKEVDRERQRWNKDDLKAYVDYWVPLLNDDQKRIYDYVCEQVFLKNNSVQIFLDGAGGSGKTVLLRCITANLRYECKIVLCTASTGIAALNYQGGSTAHSMFKIPIENLDMYPSCNIFNRSQRAELIQNADLIIWDEAPMAHKFNVEGLNNTLKDLMGNQLSFGGKNIVFSGDFRQIPPVIKYGSKAEILSSSIKFSEVWKHSFPTIYQ
ncbi:uncharacterized protein LOC135834055 [Planococcus citri]|uniref:uncharacterized protein LOC135834055 n=1 Tax=Planococcus citri TaxID=170843 RepID=UPI0031F86A4A